MRSWVSVVEVWSWFEARAYKYAGRIRLPPIIFMYMLLSYAYDFKGIDGWLCLGYATPTKLC